VTFILEALIEEEKSDLRNGAGLIEITAALEDFPGFVARKGSALNQEGLHEVMRLGSTWSFESILTSCQLEVVIIDCRTYFVDGPMERPLLPAVVWRSYVHGPYSRSRRALSTSLNRYVTTCRTMYFAACCALRSVTSSTKRDSTFSN
jgi:hypothetical protein